MSAQAIEHVTNMHNRYQHVILPRTEQWLDRWAALTRRLPDGEWAARAEESLERKRFHSCGGSIFGLLIDSDGPALDNFVARTVALQSGVDFLDDVSDRANVRDPRLVADLHRYLFGGPAPRVSNSLRSVVSYLGALRAAFWDGLRDEPGYPAIAPWLGRTLRGYTRMQTISLQPAEQREHLARRWSALHRAVESGLTWPEHHGSHGSTIPALLVLALAPRHDNDPADLARLEAAYQPWGTAFHIALDSAIDWEADTATGDFNSLSYLPDEAARQDRLRLLARRWLRHSATLPYPAFHAYLYRTMVNVYLAARYPQLATVLLADAELVDATRSTLCDVC